MPRREHTPPPLRIAIVTLRFNAELTFLGIAQKLALEERTCQNIWQRTVERASRPDNFRDLLASASVIDHSKTPSKSVNESTKRRNNDGADHGITDQPEKLQRRASRTGRTRRKKPELEGAGVLRLALNEPASG